jgi:hypothetical protein
MMSLAVGIGDGCGEGRKANKFHWVVIYFHGNISPTTTLFRFGMCLGRGDGVGYDEERKADKFKLGCYLSHRKNFPNDHLVSFSYVRRGSGGRSTWTITQSICMEIVYTDM